MIPPVRIVDNAALQQNQYRILIYGQVMADRSIDPDGPASFQVLAKDLENACVENYGFLLNRQTTQTLLDNLATRYPAVAGIVPDQVPLRLLQSVLRRMCERHMPIRNLIKIIECIEDYAGTSGDMDDLIAFIGSQAVVST